MTVALTEELERFVRDQVRSGRYADEGEVVRDALETLRRQAPPAAAGPGSIGAMREDAELLDRAVDHVMQVREGRPWRSAPGE